MNGSEHRHLLPWIAAGSRVLDLGCGDGSLLAHLRQERQVKGYGLEIDLDKVRSSIRAGVNVIRADLDDGLEDFEAGAFDTVILLQTLQAVRYPARLLDDMLRVGREGVVTFPNFGHWRARAQLGLGGTMPVTQTLPSPWYDTPNIHLCTLADFEQLCRDQGIDVVDRVVLNADGNTGRLARLWPGLFGETALYRVRRETQHRRSEGTPGL
jgi:methionine biosynthesis protein MetW